jgi:hypothetical protein
VLRFEGDVIQRQGGLVMVRWLGWLSRGGNDEMGFENRVGMRFRSS